MKQVPVTIPYAPRRAFLPYHNREQPSMTDVWRPMFTDGTAIIVLYSDFCSVLTVWWVEVPEGYENCGRKAGDFWWFEVGSELYDDDPAGWIPLPEEDVLVPLIEKAHARC